MNKVQRELIWVTEIFADKKNIENWFVDGSHCSECGFPLSSFKYYDVDHPINYCPGCGGYIEGVKNPKPPIEKYE